MKTERVVGRILAREISDEEIALIAGAGPPGGDSKFESDGPGGKGTESYCTSGADDCDTDFI